MEPSAEQHYGEMSIAEAIIYAHEELQVTLTRFKLNKLIEEGEIPKYKMLDGRKNGVRRDDIRAYIARYQPIRADLSKYADMKILMRRNSHSDHITKYYLYQNEEGILYFVRTGDKGVEVEFSMSLEDAVHLGLIETVK